jgi:nucleotide-binding universal stress UspA family protein
MVDVRQILFPTDFSECATLAFNYARDLARRYGARLTLLHVVHDSSLEVPDFGMGLAFPGYVENIPQRRKELVAEARESLEKLVNECASAVDCHVSFGSPINEILEFVERHEIEMIVLGTHGRTGFSHAILGSVAERVVRHAGCPVLTVGHVPVEG